MLKVKISSLVIILALASSLVLASFPGTPHQFYGDIKINGVPATSGAVEATINDQSVGSAPISNGKYGYNPIFLIKDPSYDLNGKLITFYVNGIEAATYIFENGGTTELALIIEVESFCGDGIVDPGEECDDGSLNGVECDNSKDDCTYCSNSCKWVELEEDEDDDDDDNDKDKKNDITNLVFSCSSNWECTGWSECDAGVMNRECRDTNNCGLTYNKPIEETGCDITKKSLIEDDKNEKERPPLVAFILTSILIVVMLGIVVNWKELDKIIQSV